MTHQRYDFSTFKRNIDLTQFAATHGYQVDRKKTTRTSIAMKSSSDKIIISKRGGVWVYFSVSDPADSGTIIDFLANRTRQSLGEIGGLLSQWTGVAYGPLPTAVPVDSHRYDPERIQRIFRSCSGIEQHAYLESRGIPGSLLRSTRFRGRIYADRYQNVAFPHYEQQTVCGLELRSVERKLMVKGSRKTLWRSNSRSHDKLLIVTEAVIDALSYHQLFEHQDALYVATSGGVSAHQTHLIADLLKSLPQLTTVILAMDNDAGGERIADQVTAALTRAAYSGEVVGHRPNRLDDDWNDALLRPPAAEP